MPMVFSSGSTCAVNSEDDWYPTPSSVTVAAAVRCWKAWNAEHVTFTPSNVTTASTWLTWNDVWTDHTAAINTQTTWWRWVNEYDAAILTGAATPQTAGRIVGAARSCVEPVRETQEQRDRRLLLEAWEEASWTNRERDAKRAHDKAQQLLVSALTEEQRKQYIAHGYFDVVGGTSGQKYRIKNGRAHNVYLLDEKGEHEVEFCITHGELPQGDIMLAQKLWLECMEEKFWTVANPTDKKSCIAIPKGKVLSLDDIRQRRARRAEAA